MKRILCDVIYTTLSGNEINNVERSDAIEDGVADAILDIIGERELNDITIIEARAFTSLSFIRDINILHLLLAKSSLSKIMKLLDHKDEDVVFEGIASIYNIIS